MWVYRGHWKRSDRVLDSHNGRGFQFYANKCFSQNQWFYQIHSHAHTHTHTHTHTHKHIAKFNDNLSQGKVKDYIARVPFRNFSICWGVFFLSPGWIPRMGTSCDLICFHQKKKKKKEKRVIGVIDRFLFCRD